MGILDEDVIRVKEQTDLVALIGEHVALKRSGQRFTGLCPFHAEKTPSFSVNPDLGFYYCFGCQASGDAITFLREVEHLDFADAVERLAGRSGITLRYDDKRVSEDRKRRDRLVEVVETAVAWCHELLLTDPDAGGARRALRSRGFDGDVARRFRLGFAPDGWDKLARHLTKAGFSRRDVVDAGMAFVNKADRLQDHLRGRLLFPIYDREGHAVGFGGRALGDDGPKYKNTGETPIYHKSSLLYGLNWAKADIVGRDQIVLCEGYTDVIAFHLTGVTQAVATCGTSLTDDHFRILKNLSRNIVLAYDADAAGQAAAEKCYRWEQEFEMHFGVAALPAGRDPAEVWQDDPDALPKVLDVAVPLLQFRLDRRLDAADTTSLEGRARSAEYVADLIAEHPSELVRDQYAVKLSERLDIDADRLRSTIEEARRRGPKPDRPTRSSRVVENQDEPPDEGTEDAAPLSGPDPDRVELEALRWAVHDPEVVADLLGPETFRTDAARLVFEALAGAATLDEAVSTAEPRTAALLTRLAVEEPWQPAPSDPEERREGTGSSDSSSPISALREIAREHAPDRVDLTHTPRQLAVDVVAQLVEERAGRLLTRLTRDDQDRAMELRRTLEDLREARGRDDDEGREMATLRLVAWLRDSTTTRGDS
ncbi:MAG: DNA primase [Acidimicrobiia bacterium]|nr:DNA primase [Acidimicrobiia bacterium]